MGANQFYQEFSSFNNYLHGFAMRLTKDKANAEDLFQETAFSAFKNRDKFHPGTNIESLAQYHHEKIHLSIWPVGNKGPISSKRRPKRKIWLINIGKVFTIMER